MLLSPEKQEELARLEEYARAKREVGKKEATSTMYTCAKCKNNKTTLTALQTRSADEPMTIFIGMVILRNSFYVYILRRLVPQNVSFVETNGGIEQNKCGDNSVNVFSRLFYHIRILLITQPFVSCIYLHHPQLW